MMPLMQLRVFQRQLLFQSDCVLWAAEQIDENVSRYDIQRTFYAIQNLLNAAANISKVLWGIRGKYKISRKAIRESIEIRDNSPLLRVAMRNNFEHMDERIDRWWSDSIHHNHIDFCMFEGFGVEGIQEVDQFRIYDPRSKVLYFMGDRFDIAEIISEVKSLLPKLREEADKPHWPEDWKLPAAAANDTNQNAEAQ